MRWNTTGSLSALLLSLPCLYLTLSLQALNPSRSAYRYDKESNSAKSERPLIAYKDLDNLVAQHAQHAFC